MFDTLKLIYTQDEALELVGRYEKVYKEKIKELEEENRKLKLHIEAKDKAYTALLKDYEELKEDNKRLKTEIEEWLNAIRQKI